MTRPGEGSTGAGDSPYLSVVIPAYNEERRIGATLARIGSFLSEGRYDAEIVLVDDGSSDGTLAVAWSTDRSGIPLQAITYRPNRGKGHAVREGMLAARGAYILMTDADLSAPIDELGALLGPVSRGEYDVAIGSRGLESSRLGVRQPWMRERMGRIFNVLVRAVTGLPFSDTQCGFKLFARSAARKLFAWQRGGGFAFDAEILYLAMKSGMRVLEEPITWNNAPGSKVNPVSDSLRMLWSLLEVRILDVRGGYDLEDPSAAAAGARIGH